MGLCGSSRDVLKRFNLSPLLRASTDVSSLTIVPEMAVPVHTARVAIANYDLIRHDFAGVFTDPFRQAYSKYACARHRGQPLSCRRVIDRWLLDHAAFVSAQQASGANVNTPIDHGAAVARGIRPAGYGRALIIPVDNPDPAGAALIDIKGAGVAPGIVPDPVRNGLEYLGVALAEFFYGNVIDRLFANVLPTYTFLPTYAVIALGFDIRDGWHGVAPAGLHVRRAHARDESGSELPMSSSDAERVAIQMECILRTFGLTSASSSSRFDVRRSDRRQLFYGGMPVVARDERQEAKAAELLDLPRGGLELVNIQLTRTTDWPARRGEIIDLGTIHGRRRFDVGLASAVRDTVFHIGRRIVQSDGTAIQPASGHGLDDTLLDRDTVHAHGFFLAQQFNQRRIESRALRLVMHRALARVGL